jgi:hypothetical protein
MLHSLVDSQQVLIVGDVFRCRHTAASRHRGGSGGVFDEWVGVCQ